MFSSLIKFVLTFFLFSMGLKAAAQSLGGEEYEIYYVDLDGNGDQEVYFHGKEQFLLLHGEVSVPLFIPNASSFVIYESGLVDQRTLSRSQLANGTRAIEGETVFVSDYNGDGVQDIGVYSHNQAVVHYVWGDQSGEVPDVDTVDASAPNWATLGGASIPNAAKITPTVAHGSTIGAIQARAGVSGGAASYVVPIEIPPGRKGMQPSVSLSYSSRAGNGVAGMGWSLDAGSSIDRCGKTVAQDGISQVVQYNSGDKLCLDGQRLQLVSGTYGAAGAVYRTELDSFRLIKQAGVLTEASFTVETPDNKTLNYGNSNNSKVQLTGAPAVSRWLLTKEQDTSGNNIQYSYTKYGSGEVLLTSIFYTGHNSTAGNREVKFLYETRSDDFVSYHKGGQTVSTQRLESIETFYAGERVFQYELDYATSQTSQRSILDNLTKCHSIADDVGIRSYCLPATEFQWENTAPSFTAPRQFNDFVDTEGWGDSFYSRDINGDGRPELFFLQRDASDPASTDLKSSVYFVDGNMQLDSRADVNPVVFDVDGFGSHARTDINLDGIVDFVSFTSTGLTIRRRAELNVFAIEDQTVVVDWNGRTPNHNTEFRDVNGDGYPDIIATFGRRSGSTFYTDIYVYLRKRSSTIGFEDPERIHSYATLSNTYQLQDLNGDGLDEIMIWNTANNTSNYTIYFAGHDSDGNFTYGSSVSGSSYGLPSVSKTVQATFADINGDGLTDYVSAENSPSPGWYVRLNKGNGFATKQSLGTSHGIHRWSGYATGTKTQSLFGGLLVVDYDGDGADELLVSAARTEDHNCTVSMLSGEQTEETICNDDLHSVGGSSDEGTSRQHQGLRVKEDGRRFKWSIIKARPSVSADTQATTFSATVVQNVVEAPLSSYQFGGLRAIDINGDGAIEFRYRIRGGYCLNRRTGQFCSGLPTDNLFVHSAKRYDETSEGLYIIENTSGVNDNMYKSTDGLGKISEWEYASLSRSAGRASTDIPLYAVPNTIAERYLPNDPNSEYFYFASNMHVVSEFHQSNGVNGLNTLRYSYREGVYNRVGRGFQGFRTIITDDIARGTRAVSDFHQRYPVAGRLEATRSCLISEGDETCSVRNAINEEKFGYSVIRTVSENQDILWVPTAKSEKITRDLATRAQLGKETNFIGLTDPGSVSQSMALGDTTYDTYGNILKTTTTVDTGFGIETSTKQNTFSPQNDEDGWWPRKLSSETTSHVSVTGRPAGVVISPGTDSVKTVTTTTLWNTTHREPESITIAASADCVGCVSKVTAMLYNAYGLPTSVTETADGKSRPSLINYTNNGTQSSADGYFPFETTNAKNHVVSVKTDPRSGLVTHAYDQNGLETTTEYDVFFRQTQITSPGAPTQYTSLKLPTGCPASAVFIVQTVQAGSPTIEQCVDLFGRSIRTTSQGFDSKEVIYSSVTYNNLGLPTFESVPKTGSVSTKGTFYDAYDELNRPTAKRISQANNQILNITYTHTGHTTSITAGRITDDEDDESGIDMTRTYDLLGRLVGTRDGKNGVTTYAYDGQGNVIAMRDPSSNWIYYNYNAFGQREWMRDPNMGTSEYTYTGFGEVKTEKDARNITTAYEYDNLGRQILRKVGGTDEARWVYDTGANGLGLLDREERLDSNFQKHYRYDSLSRPDRVTTKIDGESFYSYQYYDANFGRVKGYGYPNGLTLAYEYTDTGYQKKIKNAESEYVYREIEGTNAFGEWSQAKLGEGAVTSTRHFHAETGQFSQIEFRNLVGRLHLQEYSTYDRFGNLKSTKVTIPGQSPSTNTETFFFYDDLHRLTKSQRTNGSTIDYDYDAVGNITEKTDYGSKYHYTGSQPHAVSRVDLTAGGRIDFRYDNSGNRTHENGTQTAWYNAYNKPTKIKRFGTELEFFYGADQMRYKQVNKSTQETTLYAAPMYEVLDSGGHRIHRLYIHDAAVLNIKTANGQPIDFDLGFTHRDRLGSTVAIADEEGLLQETQSFDPFGKPRAGNFVFKSTSVLLSDYSPRGFTDHEHLDDVRLIHMNGRGYDYELGRFLSVDPYIQAPDNSQSFNPYSYIMNNPLAGTDPTGYMSECDSGKPCGGQGFSLNWQSILVNPTNRGNVGNPSGGNGDGGGQFDVDQQTAQNNGSTDQTSADRADLKDSDIQDIGGQGNREQRRGQGGRGRSSGAPGADKPKLTGLDAAKDQGKNVLVGIGISAAAIGAVACTASGVCAAVASAGIFVADPDPLNMVGVGPFRALGAIDDVPKGTSFQKAVGQLSEVGQQNVRTLQGWAKSKGWVRKSGDGPEVWGVKDANGNFSWRLKVKPEASNRHGLQAGSNQPRFDARLDTNGTYINPFTGQAGTKAVGTHIPLEKVYY